MAKLEAIRIKNLRSLEDTGWIAQKAVTLLVGRNSAGKSTYARLFPLFRQSATSTRRSPILWYGQLVDFGQFSSAIRDHDLKREIEFHFKVGIRPEEVASEYFSYRSPTTQRSRLGQRKFDVDVAITVGPGVTSGTADTVAKSFVLRSEGICAEYRFDEVGSVESLRVDGREVWKIKTGEISHVTYDALLPTLRFFKERIESDGPDGREIYLEDFDPHTSQIYSEVRKHVHGNLGEDKIRGLVSRLGFGDPEYFYYASLNAGSDHRLWIEYIQAGSKNPSLLQPLKKALFVARLPSLISAINKYLTRQFGSVKYVEPLRATAQRYYRKQDLAIDELDPKGGNVAQYLQGLPVWKKAEFDRFSKELFGFVVKPQIQGGHIELLLEQVGDKKLVNLADAGVGFSQMLPIILQVWVATSRDTIGRSRIAGREEPYLVIEQPELHLHPAYQAALADLFCEVSKDREERQGGRLVVETHSPALVNRLGSLIGTGRISPEEVQILIFEQDEATKVTAVRQAYFDSLGNLENWPYGFFEPEV